MEKKSVYPFCVGRVGWVTGTFLALKGLGNEIKLKYLDKNG
jgi:hypothetical protein